MPRKKTRSQVVKKLDKIFSIYIRTRFSINEVAQCFTCGKKDHWKKLQCGHFQSRKHYSTRWDEINCQVQCAGCNVFKYGEQFIFGQRLNAKYGEGTSEKLLQKSKQILKLSTDDLEMLINKYKDLTNIKK